MLKRGWWVRHCAGWGARSRDDGELLIWPVTRNPDRPETTFCCSDLTIFLGLETLGLIAVGQCLPQGGR